MVKRKYKNEKGFTLAELLIVVAIIAVLVAVSIPIFMNQLEKAREETDAANWRAAKAAFVVALLTDDELEELDTLHYDASSGNVYKEVRGKHEYATYGQGTRNKGYDSSAFEFYNSEEDYSNAYIEASLKGGKLLMYWWDDEKGDKIPLLDGTTKNLPISY